MIGSYIFSAAWREAHSEILRVLPCRLKRRRQSQSLDPKRSPVKQISSNNRWPSQAIGFPAPWPSQAIGFPAPWPSQAIGFPAPWLSQPNCQWKTWPPILQNRYRKPGPDPWQMYPYSCPSRHVSPCVLLSYAKPVTGLRVGPKAKGN